MSIDQSEERTAEAPPEPRFTWAAVRPLLVRLHFYAGVFVGPFLLVAALTGLTYIWTPQVEQAVYDHELHVPAAPGVVPLAQQTAVAKAAVPDGTITGIRPGPAATDSTQVIFNRPGLEPSFHHTVFVDPHTGQIRGQLETYGSGQALPLRSWIDGLHANLQLGDFGRWYSELAASWLWVVVLAGIALWIGSRKRKKPQSARGRLLSWHRMTGLVIAAGLLFLSATGLTWSEHAGDNISGLRAQLDWTTPSVSTALPAVAPQGADVGIDAVRATTLQAGLSDPVEIRPPSGPGKAYVVAQVGRSWPTKADSMAVDPATGRLTDTLPFSGYSLAAKLSRWGIDAHMGLLFGVANQIVLTGLAVGLIAVIFWGYRMWWLRRPTRGEARVGRPPVRGAWRRIPGRVLAPFLVVTAVVGYYLPVFGLSLLAFLVVDLIVGARHQEAKA
ncbi:integral membrane protein [Amycolatopsis mediterranei S699]|uniref:Integral membrane protein n=2 Tax=Amycolatopsis mediterranei TaxID=33910 RepID=A0A0H3DBB0_AMYMU|nr:PepSY-associated TM helix domain-containing protein [Amycolatopsis mediterranei]ADJ48270.1 integral membrane protein [Amycolatopsis mediterranei U32]AEK45181.1 integral membrane protein [Amycolatopsis mediterranei S699]AFO79981.1 integral membrane protein [Amycolatopsis mediterranei S699]AGT87109.1 integral membrane protein [Amycolatopsis mediterranei RB]KDO10425.1 peptidase [Amycolatopsis mediterranei]